MLQHGERHERDDPLPVRRDLVELGAAETGRDRAAPLRPVRRKVRDRQRRAMQRRLRGDSLRQRALVERPAPAIGDRLERPREIGVAEGFPGRGRPPARHELRGEARLVRQHRRTFGPAGGDRRRNGEALPRVADRRPEELAEGQPPEPLGQRRPGRHRARHRHALPAPLGHRRAPGEALRRPAGGRAARAVQAVERLPVPEDRKGVAADPVAGRLDDRQRDRRRHRRVDRVAAAQEHPEPRLRRQRLRGRDHVSGQDRNPARRIGSREIHRHHLHRAPGGPCPVSEPANGPMAAGRRRHPVRPDISPWSTRWRGRR